jgi:hypothetical protein
MSALTHSPPAQVKASFLIFVLQVHQIKWNKEKATFCFTVRLNSRRFSTSFPLVEKIKNQISIGWQINYQLFLSALSVCSLCFVSLRNASCLWKETDKQL